MVQIFCEKTYHEIKSFKKKDTKESFSIFLDQLRTLAGGKVTIAEMIQMINDKDWAWDINYVAHHIRHWFN